LKKVNETDAGAKKIFRKQARRRARNKNV